MKRWYRQSSQSRGIATPHQGVCGLSITEPSGVKFRKGATREQRYTADVNQDVPFYKKLPEKTVFVVGLIKYIKELKEIVVDMAHLLDRTSWNFWVTYC